MTHTGDTPENTSFWRRNWQKVIAASIWVALAGSFVGYSIATGTSPTDTLQDLVGLLQTPIGPLLFIVIYTLRPLAFFSAALLTVAAGAIFGLIPGVIYTIIGSNLSATVAYLLGYFLGKGLIDETKSTGIVANYANRMRRNSFETVFIMRLIFLPYDLVNYLAGILHIKYVPFILATILGSISGTFTFVLAGASLEIEEVFTGTLPSLNPWALVASALLFVGGIAVSKVLRKREEQRL